MNGDPTAAALEGIMSATNAQDEQIILDAVASVAKRLGHYRTTLVAAGIPDCDVADDLVRDYSKYLLTPSYASLGALIGA